MGPMAERQVKRCPVCRKRASYRKRSRRPGYVLECHRNKEGEVCGPFRIEPTRRPATTPVETRPSC